jgi:hypothetical protein
VTTPSTAAASAKSPDDAVRFIDLERCIDFFTQLETGFPALNLLSEAGDLDLALGSVDEPLPVQRVGAFDASFVPSHADWERLDPRFRLAPEVWDDMPEYADYGFAVFQLAIAHVAQRFHPMAIDFPRRDPGELFFPTVHVHYGHYEPTALFDHTLYCQHPAPNPLDGVAWARSDGPARSFLGRGEGDVDVRHLEAEGVVDFEAPCYRQFRHGEHPNRDIVMR